MKEIIHSTQAPDAIGPYSHGVNTGELVFLSGQLPIDKETGNFKDETITGQTHQSLTNVQYILEAAGLSMDHVVKTTVLLKNIDDFAAMNEVYQTFFKENCPARSAYAVADLPKNALVEIEVIASKTL